MLIADSMDLLREKIMSWRDCLECGGLKVNLNISKIMKSDGNYGFVENCGRWPCSVCGRVLADILFNKMSLWVHK